MERKLVKIFFPLDPNAWHGSASESLWAESLGADRYRLKNSPFYAFGVSCEDIVVGRAVGEKKWFVRVAIYGGHSTYRIRLEKLDLNSPIFLRYWAPLQELGCSYEQGDVLSVDVPPHVDIYRSYDCLLAGEDAGAWEFEEGHCGHQVAQSS